MPQRSFATESARSNVGFPNNEETKENLQPGYAVYWYNPTSKKPWYHIGVYVGAYYDQYTHTWYNDAVIEAAKGGDYHTVVARSLADIQSGLSEGKSLFYSELTLVDYSS